MVHSEICAVPAQRLDEERPLLAVLPSLRPDGIGLRPVARKVDKLSCVRFGSARYSVPNWLIGDTVQLVVTRTEGGDRVHVFERLSGEVVADHPVVAPGEVSIIDEHYGSSRPDVRVRPHVHSGVRPHVQRFRRVESVVRRGW